MAVRARTWEILSSAKKDDRVSHHVDIFILGLIILNVIAVVIESVEHIRIGWQGLLDYFEIFSVIVFSVEYLLRLWSCVIDPRYRHPLLGRLRYMVSPMALIDLAAILPSFFWAKEMDMRSVRAVRLLRIFLLAKTGRYFGSVRLLGRVFTNKREELVISFSILIFLLVVASTLMYLVENTAQPEAFADIPSTMWWAVATLTTVGYGDVAPITAWGKLLGSIVAIIGIGLFALPTSILGSGFMQEHEKWKAEITCPHCHKQIEHEI